MPVIARFYGVVIKMYFRQSEHNPPHIHAIYGEYIGAIDIRTSDMLEGDLPKRALKMVQEWVSQHERELMNMWETQEFTELPPIRINRKAVHMFHTIKNIEPLKDYNLLATFTDGTVKVYDVKPLFSTIAAFDSLQHIPGLFKQVKVDIGGYGISWNDYLDLSCDEIWEKGISQDKEQVTKYA